MLGCAMTVEIALRVPRIDNLHGGRAAGGS